MKVDVYISDEFSFSYFTRILPQVGEYVDIDSWIYSERIEGVFKVVKVFHRIRGYNADNLKCEVYIEDMRR
ncbi:hypothetical protein CHI02_23740 [Niallia circulans]|nr:hypothetical protein CHI02_23740 [Niallia circulans]